VLQLQPLQAQAQAERRHQPQPQHRSAPTPPEDAASLRLSLVTLLAGDSPANDLRDLVQRSRSGRLGDCEGAGLRQNPVQPTPDRP